jgi:hypothetical protein
MNSKTQPGWQDLFQAAGTAGNRVSWRVLRKRGEPLLVLPQSRRAAAKALALYPAQSAKARLARGFLRWLLKISPVLPMEREEISINADAPFAKFLSEQAGAKSFPALAILCGNPSTAGRRFTILVFAEQNEPQCVVKAGVGPESANLIELEKNFLAAAPESVEGIPKLFGAFRGEKLNAFAMEFFDGESPVESDAPIVEKILNGWVRENETVALGETAPWRELESVSAEVPGIGRFANLKTRRVRSVIWHGDFTPWNMKMNRATGRCAVFDWERGQLRGVPAWDWFHFVLQPALLVRKMSATALRDEFEKLLRSENFPAYAKRTGIDGMERDLALAYLIYNIEILKPSEGREPTRALLELLTNSWKND